jgi:hypothetical protein
VAKGLSRTLQILTAVKIFLIYYYGFIDDCKNGFVLWDYTAVTININLYCPPFKFLAAKLTTRVKGI